MFEIKKTVLATLACLSLTVTAVQAAETVRIEECGKAADGFTFMVDVSGSMQRTVWGPRLIPSTVPKTPSGRHPLDSRWGPKTIRRTASLATRFA